MSDAATIDLNSDLGEGFGAWRMGDDDGLLELVTSANIACGFHAGDPRIMRRVCQRAADLGVRIGAHVSYRDLVGFGRRAMDVDPDDLVNDIIYQIAALDGFAHLADTRVRYVKPHGALYNRIVHDREQAEAVVAAIKDYDPALSLLGLPGSAVLEAADAAGVPTVREAFADRAYLPDGRLAPRGTEGAVVTDEDVVVRRCVRIATVRRVTTTDGSSIEVPARSLCLHGDTPGALRLASAVKTALLAAEVRIRAFA